MKYLFRYIHKAPIRAARITKRRQKLRLRRAMVQLKFALRQERKETREMLITYRRYTQGKADSDELKLANAQFVDILKGLGLGVFAILPFAPVTIPIMVKLAQRVGVELLPSSFSTDISKQKKDRELTHNDPSD